MAFIIYAAIAALFFGAGVLVARWILPYVLRTNDIVNRLDQLNRTIKEYNRPTRKSEE